MRPKGLENIVPSYGYFPTGARIAIKHLLEKVISYLYDDLTPSPAPIEAAKIIKLGRGNTEKARATKRQIRRDFHG
mgnify:CR=1 FL=1